MNNEERNVRTILTIARILESTLWYCLPSQSKDGFDLEERKQRGKALISLTGRHSFCRQLRPQRRCRKEAERRQAVPHRGCLWRSRTYCHC